MAKLNLARLRKDEIVWMSTHLCEHSHNYLAHPQCYKGVQEKIGIWDIETSNLDADYGFILTWCIKPLGEDVIISDTITKEDIKKGTKGDEDRRVVGTLIDAIKGFDKVVGYYSKRFDAPYARARAMHMGIDFPLYGTIKHIDVYDAVKGKFRISRKRQEVACRFLLGHTEKTHVDGAIWRRAARGHAPSIAEVLDHNQRDVRDLEQLYKEVMQFSRRNDTSI